MKKTTFAALSIAFFIISGFSMVYAQMDGMQRGMMGNFQEMRINFDEAQRLVQRYLARNNLQMRLNSDHLHSYYGFYEFHVEKHGKPTYLVAVNGYTGQMLYETWLGQIVSIVDLSETTVEELPKIVIKPHEQIVRSGTAFSLDITGEGVRKLSGYQFDLTFDSEVLQAKDMVEGPFLKRDGADTFWKKTVIDNSKGQVSATAARITKGGVEGTGVLATVTFEAIKKDETVVALENLILSGPKGEAVSVSVSGTTVIVKGEETPWDVNRDGRVDILDLVMVGQRFGERITLHEPPDPDVNRDGIVNVLDLVLIGQHFGEDYTTASPLYAVVREDVLGRLSSKQLKSLQKALSALESMSNPSHGAVVARNSLRRWLVQIKPKVTETRLLQNFPNPFNPETWIPYQLKEASDITIRIYTVTGQLIRTLSPGYKPAGIYTSRQRAAYWDGQDSTGQRVSSGVYFYSMIAKPLHRDKHGFGDFTATRKLIVQNVISDE